MIRSSLILLGLVAALTPTPAHATDVTHEDYRIYRETQMALKDERLQKLPEGERIEKIAKVNFKMKGPELQAILERVDAAGGYKGIETAQGKAIREALNGTEVESRVTEVSVETGAELVITYVYWTVGDSKKITQEAALIAHRAGKAAPVTSTFVLTARNAAGQPVWRAKIEADRTDKIREDRIADWADTRYIHLFEVNPYVKDPAAEPANAEPAHSANP